MSFGQNLQFLRKSKGITQEELAESLNVSRQSVSKWESDTSYPEMDKLLRICNMFSCSMDALVKGDCEKESAEDVCGYDKHMNSFAKSIAAGIFTIIFGLSVSGFLDGLGVHDGITGMLFMTLVLVSVLIFVVSGINHDSFVKNNPEIKPFYSPQKIKDFERKFPIFMAVGIGIILIGLIATIGIDELILNGRNTGLAAAFENFSLLFGASIGVPLIAYAGMQKDKYNIEKYNHENSAQKKKTSESSEKWCGIIMLIATIIFMVTGFVWNLWRINWLAFPIGGILCAIVSLLDRNEK